MCVYVCECVCVCVCAPQIGYMDRVLAGQSAGLTSSRAHCAAVACLLLASKCQEAETRVPSPAALSLAVNRTHTPDRITQLERAILAALGWRCHIVTPLCYLGLFHAVVRAVCMCVWPCVCVCVCVCVFPHLLCVCAPTGRGV